MVPTVGIGFVYFLNRLSFIYLRGRIPDVRVFEWFFQGLTVGLVPAGTESPVGGSKMVVGHSERVLFHVNGVVIEGTRFFCSGNDGTGVETHACQHRFNGLY